MAFVVKLHDDKSCIIVVSCTDTYEEGGEGVNDMISNICGKILYHVGRGQLAQHLLLKGQGMDGRSSWLIKA